MTGKFVLLVSTATKWVSAARMPSALSRAGFEVALLAPRGSLAEKSRYLAKIGYLAANATTLDWVFAFAAMVKATSPCLVVPCDDTAVRLLHMLALSPPPEIKPGIYRELCALVRESLGNPEYFCTSVDKARLPAAAEALGVRVPPYAIAASVDEAQAFAAIRGYPVVLKRSHGAAGEWVAIVSDPIELARTYARFAAAKTIDFEGGGDASILVQAHVVGKVFAQAMTAWQGAVLAGFVREKLVTHSPLGPATVARCVRMPEIRRFSDQLAIGLGMSGFFGLEYIVDADTGEAYLLEINRRATPATHLGGMIDIDLCAALYSAVNGQPQSGRRDLDPGEEHLITHFPQEWLRDPKSRYLRDFRIDAPWDEPEVMEALLALRNDT
ncbi:MAG: Carbamoyl-phosphate synthase L chain, ATP binding domain [Candidatus Nitrotoga sp. CP45]|nr:MAG: Carbamoyl-phosphate synthase L chain, ATP binding domain [Candidatus Nitrotoga sp. CP45]